MSIQYINTGSAPNSGNGDALRTSFNKVNSNFKEISTYIVQSSTRPLTTSSSLLWYDTVSGRLFTNLGLTGSWVDTNPAVYYPFANTNTTGVVQIDGTTIVNVTTATIGVNSSALNISTLYSGTYTVSLSTTGALLLPGNVELGLNVKNDPAGVDLYSPDANNYISLTYGPNPVTGEASYLYFQKSNNNQGHFLGVSVWNSLTNTQIQWQFNNDSTIVFPDNTTQTTAFNTASYIDKATLQSIAASSTSFSDFQALIAAL